MLPPILFIALFAINFIRFFRNGQIGNLVLSLGFACFAYYAWQHPKWCLFVGIPLFIIGLTMPRGDATPEDNASSETGSAEEDPVCSVREGFVPTTLSVETPVSYSTDDGGRLAISPGATAIEFRFEVHKDEVSDMPTDALWAYHRVTDGTGTVWEAQTVLNVDKINDQLERAFGITDWNSAEELPTTVLLYEQAPREWKTAMKAACVAKDVTALDDSRNGIETTLAGKPITVMFKYQGPFYDIALLDAQEPRFVLRASRVIADYDDNDSDEIPPLAFDVPLTVLLFVNSDWRRNEESGEVETFKEAPPVIFHRTDLTGSPQPRVQLIEGE